MKRKGFTLVELIGVIVIIGLILLIVFPATVRLIKGNDERKYNQYYDLIEEAASLLANKKRDDLGGVAANGCIDVTLEDLIVEEYIKEIDEEGVTCATPSELDLSEYDEIDSTKNYVDIRITNNKGKISTETSLICVKNKKVLYTKLIENNSTCDKYVAEVKNALFNDIENLPSKTDDGLNYFITGANPNNYVLYSGKLWRVVSYHKTDKTIKLVSDESVTYLPYDATSSNYGDSNVDIWLNFKFINSLRSPEQYLLNASWNYTTVSDTNKPLETDVVLSRVGLLNLYEYNNSKEYLGNGSNWWLLSKASANSNWYVNNDSNAQIEVSNFLGIRPSIVLKSNITYIYGGAGTRDNPYRLEGDNYANSGALLNTRYSGEYVSFAGGIYRIQEASNAYTRLISDSVITTSIFDELNIYTYNSGTTLGLQLNNTWYESLTSDEQYKLVSADFCTSIVTNTTKYSISCSLKDTINSKIGIPRIGDLYVTPNASGNYWTLSNATNETINVITTTGAFEKLAITQTSGVRPVINIDKATKISGGNGTYNNPYTLE